MIIDQKIKQEFIEYLKNRDYSINTLQNYTTDLKLFFNFIRLKKSDFIIHDSDITLQNIENRKTYLRNTPTPKTSIYYTKKPTLSSSTIQSKITALKSFTKFINLIYNTWLDYRRIETKRIKSDYIECISENEFNTLFDFIWTYEKYKINSLRFQLLINIWYKSWLRLSEMLGLTVPEIKMREIRIVWKGNKPRWVFFPNSTINLLNLYVEERSKPIPRTWKVENYSDFVFISHNSWYDYWNVISKQTCCDIMKKYSDLLNIWKRITIHTLRHSYATRLLENWFNLKEIQELLWHQDIKTTENYIHTLRSSMRDKLSKTFD